MQKLPELEAKVKEVKRAEYNPPRLVLRMHELKELVLQIIEEMEQDEVSE